MAGSPADPGSELGGRTLLVGVDNSDRALDAIALADLLAGARDRVLIGYVSEHGTAAKLIGVEAAQALSPEFHEASIAAVREMLAEHTSHELRFVEARSVSEGLIELAATEQADGIIIGPSHRSSPGRLRSGGTAQSLFNEATAPVAVATVGLAQSEPSLERILCGFDGSDEADLAAEWGLDLARRHRTQLTLLAVHGPLPFGATSAGTVYGHRSVNTVLRQSLAEQLEQAASDLGDEHVTTKLVDGDAASELIAATEDFDLLVLGSRGFGPVRTVLLGSVSRALSFDAACPVVVVPRGSDAPDSTPATG